MSKQITRASAHERRPPADLVETFHEEHPGQPLEAQHLSYWMVDGYFCPAACFCLPDENRAIVSWYGRSCWVDACDAEEAVHRVCVDKECDVTSHERRIAR